MIFKLVSFYIYSNGNDKSKPLTKFEVSSSSSFEDMFKRIGYCC